MTEFIQELKTKRTSLKCKLTSLKNQLLTVELLQPEEFDDLYQQCRKIYSQLSDIHYEYCEIANSDDKYAEYRVVNSLDLDDFIGSVLQTYKDIGEIYNTHPIKTIKSDVDRAINRFRHFKSDKTTEPSTLVLQIDEHILFCKDLSERYFLLFSSFNVELDTVVEDLNCLKQHIIAPSIDSTSLRRKASLYSTHPFSVTCHEPTQLTLPTTESTHTDSLHTNLGEHEELVSKRVNRAIQNFSVVDAYNYDEAPSLEPVVVSRNSRSSSMRNENEFQFIKSSPPTFSGKRNEWAEFRAVWRKHGAIAYCTDEQRAYYLKQCLSGDAARAVRAIWSTQSNAYERLWSRLEEIYSDVSLCVQSVFLELDRLRAVKETDYNGMVELVGDVELAEVGQISSITMTQVDQLTDLLPINVQKSWLHLYDSLEVSDKIKPFRQFMTFLLKERKIAQRFAHRQVIDKQTLEVNERLVKVDRVKRRVSGFHSHNDTLVQSSTENRKCLIHDDAKHTTSECKLFLEMNSKERYALVKSNRSCFRCFQNHMVNECLLKNVCSVCQGKYHHTLLCFRSNDVQIALNNHVGKLNPRVIFAVKTVPVRRTKERATLFFDSGSDSTFITNQAAKRLGAKRVKSVTLSLTVMGGSEKKLTSCIYEVSLVSQNGTIHQINAYGLDQITEPVTAFNQAVLKSLFPNIDVAEINRNSKEIDILVGVDFEGLHPTEVVAQAGSNLRVKRCPFGLVVQGSHSALYGDPPVSTNLVSCHVMAQETLPYSNHHCKYAQFDSLMPEKELKCTSNLVNRDTPTVQIDVFDDQVIKDAIGRKLAGTVYLSHFAIILCCMLMFTFIMYVYPFAISPKSRENKFDVAMSSKEIPVFEKVQYFQEQVSKMFESLCNRDISYDDRFVIVSWTPFTKVKISLFDHCVIKQEMQEVSKQKYEEAFNVLFPPIMHIEDRLGHNKTNSTVSSIFDDIRYCVSIFGKTEVVKSVIKDAIADRRLYNSALLTEC